MIETQMHMPEGDNTPIEQNMDNALQDGLAQRVFFYGLRCKIIY